MNNWITRSRRVIYQNKPWITLEQREIELPNGRVIPDWTWVDTPDYINIAVITREGKFALFRQNKYAADGVSLAPVGGYLEADEDPLACAKRELSEEMGYEAAEWRALGAYAVDGNRGCGRGHLFLATGAQKTTQRHADDLEEQEFVLLSREEVAAALQRGDFKVMPWAAVMALALLAE